MQNDLLININGYVLSLLEKILNANVEIKGIENILEAEQQATRTIIP